MMLPHQYPNLLEIERREEALRQAVAQLCTDKKRIFYTHQNTENKDPDTYAALIYVLFLGLHHAYLRQFKACFIEATWQISMWSLIVYHWYQFDSFASWGWLGLMLAALVELNYLAYSQRIVRWYNYQLSQQKLTNLQTRTDERKRNF